MGEIEALSRRRRPAPDDPVASTPVLRDPANARALAALERLLRRAGGFRLVLAVVNHPALGARLAQAVREDLADAVIADVELHPARFDDGVELIERAAADLWSGRSGDFRFVG